MESQLESQPVGKGGQQFFPPENYKNHCSALNGSTSHFYRFSLETLQGCKIASTASVSTLLSLPDSHKGRIIVSHTVIL